MLITLTEHIVVVEDLIRGRRRLMPTGLCNVVHVLMGADARAHLRLRVEGVGAGGRSPRVSHDAATHRAIGIGIPGRVAVVHRHWAVEEGHVVVGEGLAQRRSVVALGVGAQRVQRAGQAYVIPSAEAKGVQAVQLGQLSLLAHALSGVVVDGVVVCDAHVPLGHLVHRGVVGAMRGHIYKVVRRERHRGRRFQLDLDIVTAARA